MKTYWVVQHGSGSVLVDQELKKFGYNRPVQFTHDEAQDIASRIPESIALGAHDCAGCERHMLDYLNESFLCGSCDRIYKIAFLAGHTEGFDKGFEEGCGRVAQGTSVEPTFNPHCDS